VQKKRRIGNYANTPFCIGFGATKGYLLFTPGIQRLEVAACTLGHKVIILGASFFKLVL
jgi:hypothetical protein